jgi:hypothetical protein
MSNNFNSVSVFRSSNNSIPAAQSSSSSSSSKSSSNSDGFGGAAAAGCCDFGSGFTFVKNIPPGAGVLLGAASPLEAEVSVSVAGGAAATAVNASWMPVRRTTQALVLRRYFACSSDQQQAKNGTTSEGQRTASCAIECPGCRTRKRRACLPSPLSSLAACVSD